MKVGDLIQRVQSLYSKGVQSTSTRLTSRHIYSKLQSVRKRLLAQEAKKKLKLSPWNYQTLQCVELIEIPAHQCPCLPPTGCTILRTKYKLPSILIGFNGSVIDTVSTIDRQRKFSSISLSQVPYISGNKYSSGNTMYFIQDSFLYVITPGILDVVSITAVFEDPVEVKEFPSACSDNFGEECVECMDMLDMDFPLEGDKEEALLELTYQELISMFKQIPQDNVSNNSEDQ